MMNGIPRSSINRYFQVTDVVVAHNTWVDTASPWQIGVGANTDQAEVLPASEIRSLPPARTLFANNVIYNSEGDDTPILRVDSIDGIEFRSNVIDNQGVPFEGVEGLMERDLSYEALSDDVRVPTDGVASVEVYAGFEFDRIARDVFGQPRGERNAVGATNGTHPDAVDLLDSSRYGPAGTSPRPPAPPPRPSACAPPLSWRRPSPAPRAVTSWSSRRARTRSSRPCRSTRSSPSARRTRTTGPSIRYAGEAGTPAFEMNPGGHLRAGVGRARRRRGDLRVRAAPERHVEPVHAGGRGRRDLRLRHRAQGAQALVRRPRPVRVRPDPRRGERPGALGRGRRPGRLQRRGRNHHRQPVRAASAGT